MATTSFEEVVGIYLQPRYALMTCIDIWAIRLLTVAMCVRYHKRIVSTVDRAASATYNDY